MTKRRGMRHLHLPPKFESSGEMDMPDQNQDERGRSVAAYCARCNCARGLNVAHTADESAPWLAEHGACFVTLTQFGELRGCIGSLQARQPLLADVKSNAVSAAMRDPRFTPLPSRPRHHHRRGVAALGVAGNAGPRRGRRARAIAPRRGRKNFEYGRYRSTFLPQVWKASAQPRQFLAMSTSGLAR